MASLLFVVSLLFEPFVMIVDGCVMNPLWIVLLALLILLEKVTPFGRLIIHLAGIVLVVAGAWLLATECLDGHGASESLP